MGDGVDKIRYRPRLNPGIEFRPLLAADVGQRRGRAGQAAVIDHHLIIVELRQPLRIYFPASHSGHVIAGSNGGRVDLRGGDVAGQQAMVNEHVAMHPHGGNTVDIADGESRPRLVHRRIDIQPAAAGRLGGVVVRQGLIIAVARPGQGVLDLGVLGVTAGRPGRHGTAGLQDLEGIQDHGVAGGVAVHLGQLIHQIVDRGDVGRRHHIAALGVRGLPWGIAGAAQNPDPEIGGRIGREAAEGIFGDREGNQGDARRLRPGRGPGTPDLHRIERLAVQGPGPGKLTAGDPDRGYHQTGWRLGNNGRIASRPLDK